MPELPEVETLCRQLQEKVVGQRIASTTILDHKLADISASVGKKITRVSRYGKWLTLSLTGGLFLQFHLRMTGRIFHAKDMAGQSNHARLIVGIGKDYLLLDDPRRFATVTLHKKNPDSSRTGTDALCAPSPDWLFARSQLKKVSVKTFLLDQRVLCGIGNIYACEILFSAGLDPRKDVSRVSLKDWKRIRKVIPSVLGMAISCRGTSISDWRDLFAEKGEFQNHLKVYKREGQNCFRCGAIIKRVRQNGRSTFFCPSCQK